MSLVPRSLRRAAMWCLPAILLANSVAAATLPPGFAEGLVASGLSAPTAMAFSPDGRLFICQQGGSLRVVKNGTLLATPFVTVTVNASGERGLLGIAFDPAFILNQYVYVYYTATTPNIHNRLSRFTAIGDVAVPGSEVPLLDLEPLSANNHNGGAIHFGPDGKLYVGVGENDVASNAQTLNNRLGKMLRINADGSIPEDNPYYQVATGPNRAIWALGLRNPFTFAFAPHSAAMFINDVGERSWEEINQGVAGSNYGWPVTEGYTLDPRFRGPLHAYSHSDGCAISGGAFHSLVRPQFPFKYWGSYFFADWCGGWIRARQPNGTVIDLAAGISQPVDLAFASDGSLYYLARGSGAGPTGVVYRIAYANPAPRVNLTANGGDGPLGLGAGGALLINMAFDAGASGFIDPAEVYVGLLTPLGLFWQDPLQGFVPTLARLYAGRLLTFGPWPVAYFPNVAGLLPGAYFWFILVDDEVDGIPSGDYSDFVLTGVG